MGELFTWLLMLSAVAFLVITVSLTFYLLRKSGKRDALYYLCSLGINGREFTEGSIDDYVREVGLENIDGTMILKALRNGHYFVANYLLTHLLKPVPLPSTYTRIKMQISFYKEGKVRSHPYVNSTKFKVADQIALNIEDLDATFEQLSFCIGVTPALFIMTGKAGNLLNAKLMMAEFQSELQFNQKLKTVYNI